MNTSTKPRHSNARKYDWEKLKGEFLESDILTIREFFESKKIPLSNMVRAAGWAKDKKEYQQKLVQKVAEKTVAITADNILEARQRQARLARFAQVKGYEKLKSAKDDEFSVDDARKLVMGGLEQERRALGMEGGGANPNLTQFNFNIGPKTNLDKELESMEYEEILELIADLKRIRARRNAPTINASSPTEAEDGEVFRLPDVGDSSVDDSKGKQTGLQQT